MRRSPDLASVVAGLGIASLGTMILLDQAGTIELHFAVLAPIVLAVMGAILLASGLTRRS